MPSPMDAEPPPPPAHIAASQIFTTAEHAESPKPPSPHWTGILIAAPAQIVLGAKPPVVFVRGTYRIKGVDYPEKAPWKLVVIDPATRRPVVAELGQRDPSPVEPDPEADQPVDEQTKARMTYVGHVNAELFLTAGLTPKPGNYVVRLELGPLKSNEVAVKVVAR
jgi:hypothetical protein